MRPQSVVRELINSPLDRQHTFSNDAVVECTVYPCEVCDRKGQEPEHGVFTIEWEGQQMHICEAHLLKVLEADEDLQGKGGEFEEVFGKREA